MKVGIDNLKKALVVGIEVANAVDDVTHVGTSWAEKLSKAMGLLPQLMAIPGIDFSALSAEISDLDDAEKADLHGVLKTQFDLADEKLEAAIEGAIGVLLKLEGLVKESAAVVALFKA